MPIYYGWFVTGACFLGAMAVFSVNLSFGVFFEPLLNAFDTSRTDTSIVFSLQALVLYLTGAVVGGVVDRYGTRRLMLVGTGFYALGLLATTQVTSIVEMYLTYGILTGIGMGIVYVISYTTVSRWFERRRGVATGLATAGAGIGALLLPGVAHLLLSYYTWQNAYLLVTIVMTGFLLLATALVSDSPDARGVTTGDEFPDGYRAIETDQQWLDQYRGIADEVVSLPFALLFVAFVATFMPVYTLFVHLVVYVGDIGMASWIGVGSVSLIGGASIPGRIGIGSLGDRIGRTRTFVASATAMAVLLVALPVVDSALLLLLFSITFGLIYGGAAALFAPLTIDYFGREDANAKFGIMANALGIGSVFGPVVAGLAYEVLGNYTVTFVASGLFGLVSPVLVLLVARRRAAPRTA